MPAAPALVRLIRYAAHSLIVGLTPPLQHLAAIAFALIIVFASSSPFMGNSGIQQLIGSSATTAQEEALNGGRPVQGPGSVRAPSSTGSSDAAVPSRFRQKRSVTEFWGLVRKGKKFETTVTGSESGVLVRAQGQDWRLNRRSYVRPYGSIVLAAAFGLIALFFLLRGRIRVIGLVKNKTIPRFTQAERLVHWFVAGTFILLALSGLVLLFGRPAIEPLIGKPGFAILASAMMQGHNLFGPLFIAGIIAMALMFFKDNLPRRADLQWLLKGGPLFIGHAPAWKFNAGEKFWFWMAVLGGLALSGSGIILEFPQLAGSVDFVLYANLVHGVAALLLIALSIGHIYLGSVGVEGTLQTMTTGDCTEAWARQHHSLWAEDLQDSKYRQQPRELKRDLAADASTQPAE